MRTLCLFLFLLPLAFADQDSDRAAIRAVIKTFNHTRERDSVLTRHADIPDLSGCWRQETSQIYFEATSIRFIASDVALADASANRYSPMAQSSTAAIFILKRQGKDWKIDLMRVWDPCARIVPVMER